MIEEATGRNNKLIFILFKRAERVSMVVYSGFSLKCLFASVSLLFDGGNHHEFTAVG